MSLVVVIPLENLVNSGEPLTKTLKKEFAGNPEPSLEIGRCNDYPSHGSTFQVKWKCKESLILKKSRIITKITLREDRVSCSGWIPLISTSLYSFNGG